MNWTKDKIQQIPEIYRDFMLTLNPILESRESNSPFPVMATTLGRTYEYLSAKHDIDGEQIRRVADELINKGLIQEDEWGYLTPTQHGETLIRAILQVNGLHEVPPFPSFS